eukprot:gene15909-9908_t
MEELFAPDSAGDDDAAAAPAPAVADPVDTLVGGGAADDDLGALTSTSSGGAAAAEEDGIVAQEAGAATSSAPVVQDDAVVDDYSMPVPVQVQVDPDRTARMVVSSPFSWVSLNPGTRAVDAYDLSNAQHLECAWRNKEHAATLLLPLASNPAGFIVQVNFDYETGTHKQMSVNGSGLREVRRCAGPLPHAADFADADSETVGGGTHSIPEENATHFNTVAWVHLDPVSGLISPYSGENAELIERAFRESAQSIRVGIILPNGKVLGASVKFTKGSTVHSQTTGSGFRQVKRIELPVAALEASVEVFQREKDGTCDSERYRLTQESTSVPRGEQIVPTSLGCYFETASLPTAAFARVADISRGLEQLGVEERVMRGLAKQLKTEAYLEASRVLAAAYADEQVHQAKPIHVHLRTIIERWIESGCIAVAENSTLEQPTSKLLDDLPAVLRDGLVAAAAAYLLVNPDAGNSDNDDAADAADASGAD